MIFYILLLIALLPIFYIFFLQIVRPLFLMAFYRNQGIHCQFVPLTGSNPRDGKFVDQKGDYYYDWLTKSYGDGTAQRAKLFCKNIGSVVALVLTDPQLVKEMFINKDHFIKHQFQNGLVKRLSPFGLVLLEGPTWKKHRLLISQGFTYNRVDSLLTQVQRVSKRKVRSMLNSKTAQIQKSFDFFKSTAGNIISLCYFQEDIECLQIQNNSMPVYLSNLIARLANQSYSWRYCIFGMNLINMKIFKIHRELLEDIKKMRACVGDILTKHIQRRKNRKAGDQQKEQEEEFSMWGIFMDQGNADGVLSRDEIIDQFITFFSDGVYTTGHFLTMLTYNLAKNSQWKQKLRHQLQEKLLNQETPTQSLINKLPILSACTKETLRLMPPVVTGIERIATDDSTFSDGTKVKKGTLVMACHLVNHLDPKLHDDPNKFNPHRWLDPESKTNRSVKEFPASFIPFSIGERRCPGQKFAMAEAAIFMANFLHAFDYEITDQSQYQLKFTQRFLREPLEQFGLNLKPRTSEI